MAIQNIRTATGIELTALTGSGFVTNAGGYITVKASSNLNIQGTATVSNTLNVTGLFNLQAGSVSTISGSAGNVAEVDFGTYSTVTVTGPNATWSFGQDSSLAFAGASGHTAALSIGNYVSVSMNGASSTLTLTNGTYTMAGGTWTQSGGTHTQSGGTVNHSGGTFNINGATFNQSSDCVRTGADLPSGNGAYRGLRSSFTGATNGDISIKNNDVTIVFPSNGSDIIKTLVDTSASCEHTIIQDTSVVLTNTITFKIGTTTIGTFDTGAISSPRVIRVTCVGGYVGWTKNF